MDYLQEDSQENNLLQFTRVRICCIRAWVLVRSSKPLVFWREKRILVPRVRDPKLRDLREPALVTAVTLSTHVQKTVVTELERVSTIKSEPGFPDFGFGFFCEL